MVSLSFLHSLLAFARSSGQASGRALNLFLPPSATVDALKRPRSPSTGSNGKTPNRRTCIFYIYLSCFNKVWARQRACVTKTREEIQT